MSFADDVERIRQTMHSRGGGKKVARHTCQRIATLVRPERIMMCDAALSKEPGDYFIGRVVVFTDKRVIVADLNPGREDALTRVEARTWSRSLLTEISMLGSDGDWEHERLDGSIPAGGSVRLSYRDDREILLPLGSYGDVADLDGLFDSLMEDLVRPYLPSVVGVITRPGVAVGGCPYR